jgi:hypothetical protein
VVETRSRTAVPGDDDTGPARPATGPGRWWAVVRVPVTVYAAVAGVLYAVVWASTAFLTRHELYPVQAPVSFRGARLLEGWVRFDGGWYREIATNGYWYADLRTAAPVAFFPAYPLSMRGLGYAVGDPLLAGVLLTLLSGLGIAVLFHRWCTEKLGRRAADAAVVTLLVYPYCWYLFGAVYADALFVLFALGAFVLVEHDHPVLAGLCAAVATAARPVGVGVVIGLVAVLLEHREVVRFGLVTTVRSSGWRPSRWPPRADRPAVLRIDLRRFRTGDLGLLLAPMGLALWMAWLWRTYGDPLLFAHIEGAATWDQSPGFATWFKVPLLEHLRDLPADVDAAFRSPGGNPESWNDIVYTLGITLQAVLVLGTLALAPRILRRIGWSYALFVVAVMALPLIGSKDFQGTGRYLLAAFPAFAVVGEWLAGDDRRRLRRVTWALSGLLLVVLTSGYARGYYVA